MRRSRAPSNGLGRFFAVQFSAGCTTNMSGFDFRQARPCLRRSHDGPSARMRYVTDRPFATPEAAAHKVLEIVLAKDIDVGQYTYTGVTNTAFLQAGGAPSIS